MKKLTIDGQCTETSIPQLLTLPMHKYTALDPLPFSLHILQSALRGTFRIDSDHNDLLMSEINLIV